MNSQATANSGQTRGVAFAILAHLTWGAMAPFLKALSAVNAMEIAANRAFWSIPLGFAIAWAMGRLGQVWAAITNVRVLAIMALTSLLVVFNWALYIWCITHGRTLDASLGYFINPLMNVAVGYAFLQERFTRPQAVAIGLACLGVAVVTFGTGVFPWIGVSLAGTFCLYGYIRKVIQLGSIEAFVVEVILAAIPLAAVDYWVSQQGGLSFGHSWYYSLMLMGCGAFTTSALVFYSLSIKLMRYSTAGLLQYLSPSLVFLSAVFLFGEELNPWKFAAFALIWAALAIYSLASVLEDRKVQTA